MYKLNDLRLVIAENLKKSISFRVLQHLKMHSRKSQKSVLSKHYMQNTQTYILLLKS